MLKYERASENEREWNECDTQRPEQNHFYLPYKFHFCTQNISGKTFEWGQFCHSNSHSTLKCGILYWHAATITTNTIIATTKAAATAIKWQWEKSGSGGQEPTYRYRDISPNEIWKCRYKNESLQHLRCLYIFYRSLFFPEHPDNILLHGAQWMTRLSFCTCCCCCCCYADVWVYLSIYWLIDILFPFIMMLMLM